jgi:soluble lytic murein transglycosylase-like protein
VLVQVVAAVTSLVTVLATRMLNQAQPAAGTAGGSGAQQGAQNVQGANGAPSVASGAGGAGTPPSPVAVGASNKNQQASSKSATGALGVLPPKDGASQTEIKRFIRETAKRYGVNPDMLVEIARRESSFNTKTVNDWDSNARRGTPSKGLFQFIEPTFKAYAKDAKKGDPKAWAGIEKMDWLDWRQQTITAAYSISKGKGYAWATYKAAKQTTGA